MLSQHPARLDLVPQQLEAVKAFQALPEAESLAAANKRVANILRQAEAKGESFGNAERTAAEGAGRARAVRRAAAGRGSAQRRCSSAATTPATSRRFAVLKAPVDAFFDKVMVMAEDEGAAAEPPRAARATCASAMNRVADISKLAHMKLVILDRDGTINHDSDQYIKSPEEWRPIQGSLEAIARLTQAGYRIVVATNQSGIARGLFDTATLNAIHDTLQRARRRRSAGASTRSSSARTPPTRTATAASRKPGMLLEIARRFNVVARRASTWWATRSATSRRPPRRARSRAGAHRQGREDAETKASCRRAPRCSPTWRRSPSTSLHDAR